MSRAPLPIDPVLPDVVQASVAQGAWVLHAPPGAGKTTRVPPALLQGLDPDGTIILLEPRRVAARAAARRMAEEAGEPVGRTYGYQIRFEGKHSDATRVLVLTEGVLLRKLVDDPLLSDVAAVVFDEFHERSLNADLALALVQQAREVRDDLIVGLMSATLDTEAGHRFLGEAPVLRSEGRAFPVDVQYAARPSNAPLADQVAGAVRHALADDPGDVLVFLPGVREIHDAAAALSGLHEVDVLPLHGRLSPAEQDKALRLGPRQKVVLATNVAETSVTLPGVTTVVDSGLVRTLQHDAQRALPRLVTVPCSQASADQRAGRAGRVRAGRCLRLWTARSHTTRPPFDLPEVQRADLAGAVLSLLAWGEPDPAGFGWFEAPPPHHLRAALELLDALGATEEGALTPLGQAMAGLPAHPRLARLLLAAHDQGLSRDGARLVALLSERPRMVARSTPHPSHSDLLDQLDALDGRASRWSLPSRGAAKAVERIAQQLERAVRPLPRRGPRSTDPADDLCHAVALAFPDRLAVRRAAEDRWRMANGRGARLHSDSNVLASDFLVAVDVQDTDGAEALVRLASSADPDRFAHTTTVEARYDADLDKLIGCRVTRVAGLPVDRHDGVPLPPAVAAEALVAVASKRLPRALPDDRQALDTLCARLRFLHQLRPDLDGPDGSDDSLRALLPRLAHGRRSLAELRKAPWHAALVEALPWSTRQALDRDVPESLDLPNGERVRLTYPEQGPPILAVRMQRLFGLTRTPTLGGRPVMLHLLAPNRRPQQITDDLAGFWERTWPEVRKELRARYLKHDWPEDPATATPPQRRRRR